jgi:hypothetical protein
VVNREQEEKVQNKVISFMEEAGEKAGEGDWVRELH